jgi:hypothetical protein
VIMGAQQREIIRTQNCTCERCYTYILHEPRWFPRPVSKASKQAPRHAMHIYIPSTEDSTPSRPSMQTPVLFPYSYKIRPTSPCTRTLSYKPGSFLTMGFSSNHFSNVWYMTSIVPLCTLVQTPLGPTPLNQPATPSVR